MSEDAAAPGLRFEIYITCDDVEIDSGFIAYHEWAIQCSDLLTARVSLLKLSSAARAAVMRMCMYWLYVRNTNALCTYWSSLQKGSNYG